MLGTYLTGPSDDGYGDDRLSYYDYATRTTLQEESSATFGGGDFRCDYGRSLNVATGCVFTSLAERFTRMSLSNPEHTLAAQHILVALYQPNATMPPGVNKVIPGLEETGLWLKRTVDGNTIKKNRSRARGACLKHDEAYKNDRRELDLQCDEFPFATTWQGAASGGDFSVRSMPAAQNGNGGTTLNAWYNTFRILHNDLFYVSVRP